MERYTDAAAGSIDEGSSTSPRWSATSGAAAARRLREPAEGGDRERGRRADVRRAGRVDVGGKLATAAKPGFYEIRSRRAGVFGDRPVDELAGCGGRRARWPHSGRTRLATWPACRRSSCANASAFGDSNCGSLRGEWTSRRGGGEGRHDLEQHHAAGRRAGLRRGADFPAEQAAQLTGQLRREGLQTRESFVSIRSAISSAPAASTGSGSAVPRRRHQRGHRTAAGSRCAGRASRSGRSLWASQPGTSTPTDAVGKHGRRALGRDRRRPAGDRAAVRRSLPS